MVQKERPITRNVTIVLDDEVLDILDTYQERKRVGRSEAIRTLIREYAIIEPKE